MQQNAYRSGSCRIDQSIEVNIPLIDCYKEWIDFERYPEHLSFIRSVRRKGDPNVWEWQVEGLHGQLLRWDLEIDGGRHQNHIISWHTVREADVVHSGAVTFKELGARRTLVHFVVEFKPQGMQSEEENLQRLAHLAVEKGLRHFKFRMEGASGRQHETAGASGQVQGTTSWAGAVPDTLNKM